jgi:hypothetical protein
MVIVNGYLKWALNGFLMVILNGYYWYISDSHLSKSKQCSGMLKDITKVITIGKSKQDRQNNGQKNKKDKQRSTKHCTEN